MQKVIVFGGAGRTGREVVMQALSAGYKVTAFAYSSPDETILPPHKNLKIFTGDAKNFNDVKNAIKGHDVVINIIAPKMFQSKNYPISEIATQNIVTAMQELDVKRYIGQAGAWATEHLSDASLPMRIGFKIFLPLKHIYAYKKKEDIIVKNSTLDWTLVRCGLLNDKPNISKYRIFIDRYHCKLLELPKIRRINVANFEVSIINDKTRYRTCPIIIE